MKEFNLEQAKAGKPVCTRDGRPARIICFDKKWTQFPIVALVVGHDKEDIKQYREDGRSTYDGTDKTNDDLMMVVEKHEGWINLYRDPSLTGGLIYTTKEEAESQKDLDCIATVKIEWEE